MQPLHDIEAERSRLLRELQELTAKIREAVSPHVRDLDQGIRVLETVRKVSYELVNQLQHEALVLEAAAHLAAHDFRGKNVQWSWNPRQSGSGDEPDLRGEIGRRIVVSAEVTTSRRPIGTIDRRMSDTLQKLSEFPGQRIFYVRTPAMANRARTKIQAAGYAVEVRLIAAGATTD